MKKEIMKQFTSYSKLFPIAKELLNSDEKVIYIQCECHIGGGFVVCCEECKNAKPDCFTRAEHNKTL